MSFWRVYRIIHAVAHLSWNLDYSIEFVSRNCSATITLFVTHLANHNLAYSTIRVYLAAVCCVHVAEGKHNTFESQLTPRLLLVMKGIHKLTSNISKPPRVRFPITSDILQGINTVLSAEPGSYFNKMMWAACCMAAFFSFLCSSEFTVPSQYHFDPEVHLSLFDITLNGRRFPTMVCVHTVLSSLKPIPFGWVPTYIWAKLSRKFAHSRPSHSAGKPGPVFILYNGKMLTKSIFGSELDKILRKLDLPTCHYNTHSFRIGAATSAKQSGG